MACEAAREASDGWFDPWAMPGGYDPTGLVKGWAVDQRPPVRRSMMRLASPGSRPVIRDRELPQPARPARNDPGAHMVGAGDQAAPRTRRQSNAGANTYDGPE
jgi:hypothetical protein